MLRPFVIFAFLCSLLSGATPEDAEPKLPAWAKDFAMPMRIYNDATLGLSFRYPYNYSIPYQYGAGLMRPGHGYRYEGDFKEKATMKEILKGIKDQSIRISNLDVTLTTYTMDSLPQELRSANLAGIATGLTKGKGMTFASWDYYQADADRLFAAAAPKGVEAVVGKGAKFCALALKWESNVALLVCRGPEDEEENRKILRSLEIQGKFSEGKTSVFRTWAHNQCQGGKVLMVQGRKAITPTKESKVSWKNGWELETAHYHVSTNVGGEYLQAYGKMMEALYDAYVSVWKPERLPPYKMEIHVFKDQEDFSKGAGANNHGSMPPGVLGFFAPGQLAIYSFERYDYKNDNHNLFSTLAHEASHQFLHVACNGSDHVPTWINEGLAVYFESSKFENGKLAWYPPAGRLGQLKAAYKNIKGTVMSIEDYIKHRGHISAIQYGEVYSLTSYLVFSGPVGRAKFLEYWQALRDGEQGDEAFERIFMKTLEEKYGSRDKVFTIWTEALRDYVLKDCGLKQGGTK